MYANIFADINDKTVAISLVPHMLQFAGLHRLATDCMGQSCVVLPPVLGVPC